MLNNNGIIAKKEKQMITNGKYLELLTSVFVPIILFSYLELHVFLHKLCWYIPVFPWKYVVPTTAGKSIRPIAVVTRAIKTTYSVRARCMHVTGMSSTGAFVDI